jgi:lysyl-tRNA synthetase class 2
MSREQPPPLSPSDLRDRADGPVRVAGRWRRASDGHGFLTDALAAVAVEHEPGDVPQDGDLVELDGWLVAGGLRSVRWIARHRPRRPPATAPGRVPRSETTRLQDEGVGPRLRLRADVLRTIRGHFERQGFLEVDTPAIVPSPGLDVHLDAFGLQQPVAGAPAYLHTSPEYQMKRLLAGGLPRIYQLAHAYRRDEEGQHHNPEFLMLEWYRAFAGVEWIMADTERLVREVLTRCGSPTPAGATIAGVDLEPPFLRWSVRHAFAELGPAGVDPIALARADEERFFRIWVDAVEPGLAALDQPVFVTDFPAAFASLARSKPDDPLLCERFELYLAGIELCNGFGELTDPEEQRRRLEADQRTREATGKPVYPIDERFLAALTEGVPPSAGNALGVDRLVAIAAGATSVAAVQPFPVAWL